MLQPKFEPLRLYAAKKMSGSDGVVVGFQAALKLQLPPLPLIAEHIDALLVMVTVPSM